MKRWTRFARVLAARTLALGMLAACLVAGCDGSGGAEDAAGGVEDVASPSDGGQNDTRPADDVTPNCERVKVDMLWVVDDSTSMCQEQVGLAAGMPSFVARLTSYVDIDLRVAVVTTAALVESKAGRFLVSPATEFPPVCQERRYFPAWSDLHCECAACTGWDAAFAYQCGQDEGCGGDPTAAAPDYTQCIDAGGCGGDTLARLWRSELPVGGVENLYNANGSLNSTCQIFCGKGLSTMTEAREVGTERCREWFGDDTMVCQVPDLPNSGCLKPPDTAGCPVELPAVLPAYEADGSERHGLEWFRCLATVGADQQTAANLEQGLKSAWLALSEDGPAPTQICEPDDPTLADETLTPTEQRAQCARRFLRDDAVLVLVFVSDEDDCSVADGRTIWAEDYNRCALLGDDETAPLTNASAPSDERPLATVASYVERFRSLQPDPERLIVAAIAGDAWKPNGSLTPEEVEAARALYYESKVDRSNRLALNTSIAVGPTGRADLGMRYIRLVEAFGARGFFHNIVAGVPEGLPTMGDAVGALVSQCRQ